jgi:hypothetical protein
LIDVDDDDDDDEDDEDEGDGDKETDLVCCRLHADMLCFLSFSSLLFKYD